MFRGTAGRVIPEGVEVIAFFFLHFFSRTFSPCSQQEQWIPIKYTLQPERHELCGFEATRFPPFPFTGASDTQICGLHGN